MLDGAPGTAEGEARANRHAAGRQGERPSRAAEKLTGPPGNPAGSAHGPRKLPRFSPTGQWRLF